MKNEEIIKKLKLFIQDDMKDICSAHDWHHIERVYKLACKIADEYADIDMVVVESGALLHEYLDEKFFDEETLICRSKSLQDLLQSLGINATQREQITFIINNVGFGKSIGRETNVALPLTFQIVEDADRLEAIGAIAIARTFAYGGSKGRAIYDPDNQLRASITRENYRQGSGTSINHFYEKLLLLKDLLHTPEAKNIAEKRHAFMEQYLEQFFNEWNGSL